jgi:hypothetical protein
MSHLYIVISESIRNKIERYKNFCVDISFTKRSYGTEFRDLLYRFELLQS